MKRVRLRDWGNHRAPRRLSASARGAALSIALIAAWCGRSPAADDRPGIDFFESKIRPVLVERCQKCHSAALARPKGQLRLDTRDGARKGGASGPAVVPGDLEASVLYQAITAADGYSPMPPKEKLPTPVVADFRRWIEMGAPDPRDGTTAAAEGRRRRPRLVVAAADRAPGGPGGPPCPGRLVPHAHRPLHPRQAARRKACTPRPRPTAAR